jgi:hypothetical protein
VVCRSHFQRHEETLALNISEGQVDASGITFGVAVANDMVEFRVDALNQALRELCHASVIVLGKNRVSKGRPDGVKRYRGIDSSVPLHDMSQPSRFEKAKPNRVTAQLNPK